MHRSRRSVGKYPRLPLIPNYNCWRITVNGSSIY